MDENELWDIDIGVIGSTDKAFSPKSEMVEQIIVENDEMTGVKINLDFLLRNSILSEDILEKYKDRFDWSIIIQEQTLSEEFIRRNMKYISNLLLLLKHQKVSCSFLEEYFEKFEIYGSVIWDIISKHQVLTEEYLSGNISYLSKPLICKYQELSEEFIEKYIDSVDWGIISKYQRLSFEFICKNFNKLKYMKREPWLSYWIVLIIGLLGKMLDMNMCFYIFHQKLLR